jgi:hypothetical protein
MSQQTPDRPDNWRMDYSKCDNVTDANGVLLTTPRIERDRRDLGKAWATFRERFRNQPPRDTGGYNAYNPPMDVIEWKELNRE